MFFRTFQHLLPRAQAWRIVVAKRLRQVLSSRHDEVSVTVSEDRVSATYDHFLGLNFYVGDWIVEGFDYTRNKVIFDRATQKTREKHDLR